MFVAHIDFSVPETPIFQCDGRPSKGARDMIKQTTNTKSLSNTGLRPSLLDTSKDIWKKSSNVIIAAGTTTGMLIVKYLISMTPFLLQGQAAASVLLPDFGSVRVMLCDAPWARHIV